MAAFAALFAALVVWTTVAMPGTIADFDVDRLVPVFSSSSTGGVEPDHTESP